MTDEFPLYLFFVGFFLLAVILVALVGWAKKGPASSENELTRRRREVERVMNDPALRAPGGR